MNQSDGYFNIQAPGLPYEPSTGHTAEQYLDALHNPVGILSLHTQFSGTTFAGGGDIEAITIGQLNTMVDVLVPGVYKMILTMDDTTIRGGCHWAIGVTANRTAHPALVGNRVSAVVQGDLRPTYFSIKDGGSTEVNFRTRNDASANTGTVYLMRIT